MSSFSALHSTFPLPNSTLVAMQHARTIAMATTLLADGRAEDVAEMIEPLLDPVTAPAASTGQILLRGLKARIEVVHRNRGDKALNVLPALDEVSDSCTCVRAEVALWRGWGHARASSGRKDTIRAALLLRESQELFASIHDPVGHCWALLGRAQAYFVLDEYGLMRRLLEDASALLRQLQDTQAERWLHELKIPAHRWNGEYDQAKEHVQALCSIASEWDDRRIRGRAAAHSAALKFDLGHSPSSVIEEAQNAFSLFQQADASASYPQSVALRAYVGALLRQGNWREALKALDPEDSILSEVDAAMKNLLRTLRARVRLRQGRADEPKTSLEALLNGDQEFPPGFTNAHLELLYGLVLVSQHSLDEAEAWMKRAHRSSQEMGHRGIQYHVLLSLAHLAAHRGDIESFQSRRDLLQEFENSFQPLPHAGLRFFVEGVGAHASGSTREARQAYCLARIAAERSGDRPRAFALRQLLDDLDREDPSSLPSLACRVPEALAADPKEALSDNFPDRFRPEDSLLFGAENFDPSSLSALLVRASVSVPLVVETWLEASSFLLPENRWRGLFRVSSDGSSSLLGERGPRPSGAETPPTDQNASPSETIRWITLSGQNSGAAFFLGIERPSTSTEESNGISQIESWVPVLRVALSRNGPRPDNPSLPASVSDPASTVEEFVAESNEMQALAREIRRIQPSQSPVLLTGEEGTGKPIVARAIHETSERANGPLEYVSCARTQHSGSLEARLFGRKEEGTLRPGAVHAADGGTLVVEDIDALSDTVQSSLLRLLDTGRTTPVGGTEAVPVDIRLVATTTADLDARVQEGRFRSPLRNGLSTIILHVPPLRERRADIPLLVRHFFDTLRPDEPTLVSVTQPAREALLRYNWPGNVRQLRNEIERALVHVQSEPSPTIDTEVLQDAIVEDAKRSESPRPNQEGLDAILQPDQTLNDVLSRTEKSVIERVLQACDGQITASADVLGLTRQGLYKKMKRLDIDASSFQPSPEPAPTSS